jgi:hypothetical protein
MELQDLAPSDGLWKIFIFPGDILVPAEKERLDKFGAALSNSIVSGLTERLCIYTVLSSSKEKAIWSDVPMIARNWKKLVFNIIRVSASNENFQCVHYRGRAHVLALWDLV